MYFYYFFFLIFINLLIFKNFKRISNFFYIYDIPNKRKLHKIKTPLIGGIIFYFNLIVIQLGLIIFSDKQFFFSIFTLKTLIIFNFFLFLIFIIGILDDKFSLNHYLKLFFTTSIVYAFIYFDPEIKIEKLIFEYKDFSINLGKYSIFFTILSFMLFLNAANMFDGINLQSSLFFTFCLTILMFKNAENFYISLLIIPLMFIMFFNYNGKIFLGNNGVLILSFLLSTFFIKNYNQLYSFTSDEIFLIMLIPGLDMFRLFLQRLFNKKNPFKADQNHIHHLFIKIFSIPKTNILITSAIILSYLIGSITHYILGIILAFFLYLLSLVYLKTKK